MLKRNKKIKTNTPSKKTSTCHKYQNMSPTSKFKKRNLIKGIQKKKYLR